MWYVLVTNIITSLYTPHVLSVYVCVCVSVCATTNTRELGAALSTSLHNILQIESGQYFVVILFGIDSSPKP
mgnify:CR=1 FL=1